MFTCAVRLLDISRVDRLVFSSSSWPSLCRLSWLSPSNKLPACLPPSLPACRHGPNSSSLPPVIAAASCRSGVEWRSCDPCGGCTSSSWPRCCSCTWRALRGLLVLFVAFLVRRSFWRKTQKYAGKNAGKNAHFFVTRADYSEMCLKIWILGLFYCIMCLW